MKLRILILDKDNYYKSHLMNSVESHYSEKMELYFFSDLEKAYDLLDRRKIDIVLMSESFELDESKILKKYAFAYLTESSDINSINNKPVVAKYQALDVFYKKMIKLYENVSPANVSFGGDESGRILCFTSPMGGAGVTTAALSCAIEAAHTGKKVLYLDYSLLGDCSSVLKPVEGDSFSEIIYALHNQQSNISLKIRGVVQQDRETGVYFFPQTQVALDNEELTDEDIVSLVNEILGMGEYQYIIIDMDFGLNKRAIQLMNMSSSILLVANGNKFGEVKLKRAVEALKIMDSDGSARVVDRIRLIGNGVNKSIQDTADELNIKYLCDIPSYDSPTPERTISMITRKSYFGGILK